MFVFPFTIFFFPPFFLLKLKSLLCRQGSLFVKSEPSSFCFVPKTEKEQRASSPSFYPLFRSNRHPVVWLAHQPLVIQNEELTHTVLENSLPPPWTAYYKPKQGNMCQQVTPNDCSSRLWDRICEYNSINWLSHLSIFKMLFLWPLPLKNEE